MDSKKAFFKELHPDQFSDSSIVKVGRLDRDFFDFFLDSLTSKGLERDFEIFCRRIAEKEICPNLLPQTGPTGGGDSKVDSETYPVSETISHDWYCGFGDIAAAERWAFAFSAKKDWRPKVISDIEKIIETNNKLNRDYKKIFFISNQYISDKKRADVEDDFRKKYQLDIRILDRTWLLEKVFSKQINKNIAIECFSLSDCFKDEIAMGNNDYRRQRKLDEIEAKLSIPGIKKTERLSLMKQSIRLARELELSEDIVYGLINRYKAEACRSDQLVEIADSIYDAAWTIYWWYHNPIYYYEQYIEYEHILMDSDNVYFFNNLITLWINLFTLSYENDDIQIDKHTLFIKDKYQKLINDSSKPNTALEAKASFQIVRFFTDDDLNDITNDMIDIVNKSSMHLDIDLYPISRIVQEFQPLKETKRYDELFELLVTVSQNRSSEISAADLLAKRGHLLKDSKPYDALNYLSRCLIPYHNEEGKNKLIAVLIDMADVFQKVDLFWAARNYYYYAFCLCFSQYMKFGDVSPGLFITSHSLKYIELKLGRMLYSSEFSMLEKLSIDLYPKKLKEVEEEMLNYDGAYAVQIFRTSFEIIKKLGHLPEYLERRGLDFAKIAIEYEMGYYNDELLNSLNLNESTESFDELMSKWKDQPVLSQLKASPWYGFELPYIMFTSVLGCQLELHVCNAISNGEVEVASTILATIESFLGTGAAYHLFSMTGKIVIYVEYSEAISAIASIKIDEAKPNCIFVFFRKANKVNFANEQNDFSEFLLKLLSNIMMLMFPYDLDISELEKRGISEYAYIRSQTFSNSVFYGLETFGTEMFLYDYLMDDYNDLAVLRTEKALATRPTIKDVIENKPKGEKINVVFDNPPESEFSKIGHNDIKTISVINIPLWNRCGWSGVCFLTPEPPNAYPPFFSLMFSEELSKNIFKEWITEVGCYDTEDKIIITIIKGIDKKNPYWYRVIISSSNTDFGHSEKPQYIIFPSRVHTMHPENNVNLTRFEKSLRVNKHYYICPTIMKSKTSVPKTDESLKIKKNSSSIRVINAWEIVEDDIIAWSGILPSDNPIIPDGNLNLPVLKMIERKKDI